MDSTRAALILGSSSASAAASAESGTRRQSGRTPSKRSVKSLTAADPPAATVSSSSATRRSISAWVSAARGSRCARNRLFRVSPRKSRMFTRAILVVVARFSASGPYTGQMPTSTGQGPTPPRTGQRPTPPRTGATPQRAHPAAGRGRARDSAAEAAGAEQRFEISVEARVGFDPDRAVQTHHRLPPRLGQDDVDIGLTLVRLEDLLELGRHLLGRLLHRHEQIQRPV